MNFKKLTMPILAAIALAGCSGTQNTNLYHKSGDLGGYETYQMSDDVVIVYHQKIWLNGNIENRRDIPMRAAAETCKALDENFIKIEQPKLVWEGKTLMYGKIEIKKHPNKLTDVYKCSSFSSDSGFLIKDVLENTKYLVE